MAGQLRTSRTDLSGSAVPTLRTDLPEAQVSIERRDNERRAEVVRAVVAHVVHKSESTVTVEGLQSFLHVPPEAAGRIVSSLVNAGIVKEVREGVWSRVDDFPKAP